MFNHCLGVFLEPIEYEDFEEDDDVIDLRAFEVVGGIIDFNLINMPPQPKQADKWTIVQCKNFPKDFKHDTLLFNVNVIVLLCYF